jgi:hypothetical protein
VANFVNNVQYSDDFLFEILETINNDPATSGLYDKNNIALLPFYDLEHGMRLKDNTIIKKISTDNKVNSKSFYFMHIPKNSGLSLQQELKQNFKGHQTFINQISYINDEDMLRSKLISGHFASYPFSLYKKNNLNLSGVTMLRDPVDRCISYFMHTYNIFNIMLNRKPDFPTQKSFDRFLSEPSNLDFITNFQCRSMTSSINFEDSNKWSTDYLSNKINKFSLFAKGSATSHFIENNNNGSLWKEKLNNFAIIGTTENRTLFLDRLSKILQKSNYNGNFLNIKKNKSLYNTGDIKKMLSQNQMKQIIDLNNYDFEMYDFLMTNKGVWEC